MNACQLTRLDTELRVAIREALRGGEYYTDASRVLYSDYCANGGTATYADIRRDEAAQIGIVLDSLGNIMGSVDPKVVR